jgi:glycerophosphoryl diester phosphodiesterase
MIRRLIQILSCFLLFLIIAYAILSHLAKPIEKHPFFTSDDFLVIAHRGGRGLGPENTLDLFKQTVEMGVDVLEMDLRRTKDGVLVVLHDRSVDRTTNGKGPIENYTLKELKALDAAYYWSPDDGTSFPLRGQGITVPTLTEVFETFPDMRFILEIKDTELDTIESLGRIIREYNKEHRVIVASFDSSALKHFRTIAPAVATSATAMEAFPFYWLYRLRLDSVYTPHAQVLMLPLYYRKKEVITSRFLKTVHQKNIRVHVWTVNRKSRMKHLLALGVDGIMTDYPDRLIELLGRKK